MTESTNLPVTKVSANLSIPGYFLDRMIAQKIDEISKDALKSTENSERLKLAYWITYKKSGRMVKFETVEKFLEQLDSEKVDFSSVSFQYVVANEASMHIEFADKGNVSLSAFSNAPDFQFNIDRLLREIQKCEQEYNWFVKRFVLKGNLPKGFLLLIIGFSWLLFSSITFYFYARNVGVDIDPAVIPAGNEFFHQIENAIRDDSLSNKLDVLLIAQLRRFTNVQDILQRLRVIRSFTLVGLVVTTVLFFLSRFVVTLYPLAFLDFESHQKTLIAIYRKREIVWVGVIIGFVVNVIAGLVIALLD